MLQHVNDMTVSREIQNNNHEGSSCFMTDARTVTEGETGLSHTHNIARDKTIHKTCTALN